MNKLKRFLVILVTMVVSVLLQIVLLPLIPHLLTVPNLLMVSVVSFGFLYGRKIGMVTGFIAGLILDIAGNGTPGFFALILTLLGYGDGYLSEKMESEIVLLLLAFIFLNEVLFHSYTFLFGFLIGARFTFVTYFSRVFVPESILTAVCFVAVYGVLLFLSKKWELRLNKGAVRIV